MRLVTFAPLLVAAAACRTEAPAVDHRPAAPSESSPAVPSPATTPAPPQVFEVGPDGADAGAHPHDLVVFLHGVGASADSFRHLAEQVAPAIPQARLVIPDGFYPFDGAATGRQWFGMRDLTEKSRGERVGRAGREVSEWIDAQLDRQGLAHDRVAIVGFSQGAMLAAWLSVHRSPSPRAVVVLSGRVSDDAPPVPGSVSTPVLWLHGAKDTVIPAAYVEPGVATLTAWGARVTKRTYPDLAHQVDARELAETKVFLAASLGPR